MIFSYHFQIGYVKHNLSFVWFFYSTVSSGLNSLAAAVLEDFIKPLCAYRQKELTDVQATLCSKFLGQFKYLIYGNKIL